MVLLNFLAVRKGGGLQNALSFLKLFAVDPSRLRGYLVICVRGSEIAEFCIKHNLVSITVPRGLYARVYAELILIPYCIMRHRVEVIFSLFGGPPLISPGVFKISGCAYSNIIVEMREFWDFLPLRRRLVKYLIDRLRLFLVRRADVLIVETEYLYSRAVVGCFKDRKVRLVKMAPSEVVLSSLWRGVGCSTIKDTTDILYLAGDHPNKRIHTLAEVFFRINQFGKRFRLIVTLPEHSDYYARIRDEFAIRGAENALKNVGPIKASDVGELLKSVDGMINVALLESFSNNWVEAWAAGLPLICTEAEWAKASCGEAAIYISPEDADEAARRIVETFDSAVRLGELKAAGDAMLAQLPSPAARFDQYLRIVEEGLTCNRRLTV